MVKAVARAAGERARRPRAASTTTRERSAARRDEKGVFIMIIELKKIEAD